MKMGTATVPTNSHFLFHAGAGVLSPELCTMMGILCILQEDFSISSCNINAQ